MTEILQGPRPNGLLAAEDDATTIADLHNRLSALEQHAAALDQRTAALELAVPLVQNSIAVGPQLKALNQQIAALNQQLTGLDQHHHTYSLYQPGPSDSGGGYGDTPTSGPQFP